MKVYVANPDGSLGQVCVACTEGNAQILAQAWKCYYPSDRVFYGDDVVSAVEVVMKSGSGMPFAAPMAPNKLN